MGGRREQPGADARRGPREGGRRHPVSALPRLRPRCACRRSLGAALASGERPGAPAAALERALAQARAQIDAGQATGGHRRDSRPSTASDPRVQHMLGVALLPPRRLPARHRAARADHAAVPARLARRPRDRAGARPVVLPGRPHPRRHSAARGNARVGRRQHRAGAGARRSPTSRRGNPTRPSLRSRRPSASSPAPPARTCSRRR